MINKVLHQDGSFLIIDLSGHLLRQSADFERLARKSHRNLTVNQVHDLRVLTRRIRASVWLARRICGHSSLPKLRRALRRLGGALGERRMFDVALEDARAFGIDASTLAAPRAYAGETALRRLKVSQRKEIVSLIKKASAAVEKAPLEPLAKGLVQLQERLFEALRAAPKGKAEQHALRIEAKKVRYILEIFGRPVGAIKALQGHLGRAHDLEILQELLGPDGRLARDEQRAWEKARRNMRKTVISAADDLAACAAKLKPATLRRPRAKR